MRRLALAVAFAGAVWFPAGSALADPCEPEDGGCHPRDCMEYDLFREIDQVSYAAATGDPQQVTYALDSCY